MYGSQVAESDYPNYDLWDQSVGGNLDFPLVLMSGIYEPDVLMDIPKETLDQLGGFIYFGEIGKGKAYNYFDAGQFLWGQAAMRLGSSSTAIHWGSNLNEIFSGGDSWSDQRAISAGFNYRVSRYGIATAHPVFRGLEKGFESYSSPDGFITVHTHSGIFFPQFPAPGITLKGHGLQIHSTTITTD